MNSSPTVSERPGVAGKTKVSYVPKGYHTIIPYLIVKGAARALDYYEQVFGASEVMRMPGPNDKIVHAEIKINGSTVMLADEMPGMEFKSPPSIGGSPVGMVVYVEDVDACVTRATSKGGRILKPVQDQFYGDRSGTVLDPFGHIWTIATHIEDVAPEEMQRRMAQMKPCG
jgi:PhnB protein